MKPGPFETGAHTHGANELILYANSTGKLYPEKKRIIELLKGSISRGSYNQTLARATWNGWLAKAQRMYRMEIGTGGVPGVFSAASRKEAAAIIAAREHSKIERGEYGPVQGNSPPIRRGIIGSRGIEPTISSRVLPGHLYALGASSAPDIVYVTEVTDDRIKFLKWPYTGKEQIVERWIGEDLIARGTENHLKLYGDRSILKGHRGRKFDLRELQETVARAREHTWPGQPRRHGLAAKLGHRRHERRYSHSPSTKVHIAVVRGGWGVISRTGRSMGNYRRREEAEHRLRQIEAQAERLKAFRAPPFRKRR
jgi:hypothetical protein